MPFRQLKSPNLSVTAQRGWCLKYIDDSVNAPARKPTAQAAFNTEKANGNVRTSGLPIGVWVPIWFSLTKGVYAGLGHVAWAYNYGDRLEIRDSETRTGARSPYTSIDQVKAWFGNYAPQYLGWSFTVDGVQVVEEYTPPPTPVSQLKPVKGVARVIVDKLNVRNEPSTTAPIAVQYERGQTFNYDGFIVANGFVWLSYVSYSGVRRYIAQGPNDGNPNTIYVTGGVA